MRLSIRVVLTFAATISGCSEFNRTTQFLTGHSDQQEVDGEIFTFHDRPQESQMLLTPGFKAYVQAAWDSGRYGRLSGNTPYDPHFDVASVAYLRHTGRDCTIVSHREVSIGRWEITYKCK